MGSYEGNGSWVVWTGSKPMKASCIGAAGMTSGFGPSDQECLWLCRKLIFLRRIIILCHALTHSKVIHAFAAPAEREKMKNWEKKIQKKNYALKGSRLMNGAKGKGQAWTQVSLGYSRVKACGFFFSLLDLQGSDVRDVIDWTPPLPLRSVTAWSTRYFWF